MPIWKPCRQTRASPTLYASSRFRQTQVSECNDLPNLSNDQATKAADAARLALQGEIAVLQALNIPKRKDVEHAVADYRKLTENAEQVAVAIVDYLEKAEARRLTLVDAANSLKVLDPKRPIREADIGFHHGAPFPNGTS